IARDDAFGLYDDNGSFCEDRFEALVKTRGWTLPRTPTGRLALDKKTFGKQCRQRPELRALQKLRDQIAELRLGRFLNTTGADGVSRCPVMPHWTRSGRNQPQARDKAFCFRCRRGCTEWSSRRRAWALPRSIGRRGRSALLPV